jgi:UDP-glucose 4-epimerase
VNSAAPQRILITGAFGYVGGRLAHHLSADPANTVMLASRAQRAEPSWLPRVTVLRTDFDDIVALREACAGVAAVVHLAGANARACSEDVALAFEVNAVSTARLVTAARQAGVRRLIYLSTAHVYGSPLRGVISEDTCARGIHPYAASHRAGEDVVLHAGAGGKLEALAVRLSNSFGPPMDAAVDCWTLLVNDLSRQAVTTRRLVLSSAGIQRRDFITLTDTCRAIAHLLRLPRFGDGLFNLGGQWAPTVRGMAVRIAARCPIVLGHEVKLEIPEAAPGETSGELDFRIDKLLATDFSLAGKIDAELDASLAFCAAHERAPEIRG